MNIARKNNLLAMSWPATEADCNLSTLAIGNNFGSKHRYLYWVET